MRDDHHRPRSRWQTGKEPIRTLARHRLFDHKTMFAIHLIPETTGRISVGDEVTAAWKLLTTATEVQVAPSRAGELHAGAWRPAVAPSTSVRSADGPLDRGGRSRAHRGSPLSSVRFTRAVTASASGASASISLAR